MRQQIRDEEPDDGRLSRPVLREPRGCKSLWATRLIGHPKAGQRSAIVYTIIEECRLHGVDPFAYLVDVMPKIMDHSSHRIADLLPKQWAKSHG